MLPIAPTSNDIDADFEVLEAIGARVDDIVRRLAPTGAIRKTMRKWLVGHADPPDDEDEQACLMAMAADLEMFTPSASGRTLVDRRLRERAPQTPQDRQAVAALGAAQFHLVRIAEREGPDLVWLHDLVTGDNLLLLDSRISPLAEGLPTAMRLCPLESGRHVLTTPLFAMDEEMLDEAMTFVRHGRPLGTGHRCAASIYRNVARRGFYAMPQHVGVFDEEILAEILQELTASLSPVQHLALRWIGTAEADPDLAVDARALATADNLVDVLDCFAQSDDPEVTDGVRTAFEQIAAVQVETLVERARAGEDGAALALDQVAQKLADQIAQGKIDAEARDLFERLRQRSDFAGANPAPANASAAA